MIHISVPLAPELVQFYSKAGKALYKECFHWTDILLVMPNYRKEERYASV